MHLGNQIRLSIGLMLQQLNPARDALQSGVLKLVKPNSVDGDEIVAQGTPEDIVKVVRSYTGQLLKAVLGREAPGRVS
jgi:hypothetical protein